MRTEQPTKCFVQKLTNLFIIIVSSDVMMQEDLNVV